MEVLDPTVELFARHVAAFVQNESDSGRLSMGGNGARGPLWGLAFDIQRLHRTKAEQASD